MGENNEMELRDNEIAIIDEIVSGVLSGLLEAVSTEQLVPSGDGGGVGDVVPLGTESEAVAKLHAECVELTQALEQSNAALSELAVVVGTLKGAASVMCDTAAVVVDEFLGTRRYSLPTNALVKLRKLQNGSDRLVELAR